MHQERGHLYFIPATFQFLFVVANGFCQRDVFICYTTARQRALNDAKYGDVEFIQQPVLKVACPFDSHDQLAE